MTTTQTVLEERPGPSINHGESTAVDPTLEDESNEIAVPCVVVAAMQDLLRASTLLLQDEDLPNLCWNWLWFRRFILGVPARCRVALARCHYIDENPGVANWVEPRELLHHIRDVGIDGEERVEFVEQLDWFRQLVFDNGVVTLVRHQGGELGMRVVGTQKYADVRKALPGFLSPISEEIASRLRDSGYTSLYRDGNRHYVLYGPLCLVQHADVQDVVLGRPMLGFDWVMSVGSKLFPAPGLKTIREIRLRGEGRGAEARLRAVRPMFRNDEEIKVNYEGNVVGGDDQDDEVECVQDTRQLRMGRETSARGAGGVRQTRILLVEDEEEKVSGVCVGPTNMHEPSAEEEVGSADSSGEDGEEGD